MKFFLLKILYISIFFAAEYVVILFINVQILPASLQKLHYARFRGDHLYTKLSEADTAKKVDVLVLGASHAYRGFDPRIFKKNGINIFVLGSSSQTPIQTEYLVNKYIDKFKPKLVLYDVDYNNFETDGLESAESLFSAANPLDWQLLVMAIKLNSLDGYNTFTYSFLKALANRGAKEPRIFESDEYISNGFVQRRESKSKYIGRYFNRRDININKTQFQTFISICQKLARRGVKTLLIQSPTSPGYYRSLKNITTIDRMFSLVQTAKYYNFNDTTIFKNELFYDQNHLNQQGVELFDSILIKQLKNDGEFDLLIPEN